jgi:SlyX protein
MGDTEALSARIDTLEMRLAYQDKTIEELNETVVAQWKQIDALNRQIAMLSDRVRRIGDQAGSPSAPEPPPPHY